MADVRTAIGTLEFQNPVILASGTCGYGMELADKIDLNQIGGLVLKTVTLKPRRGNPPRRIHETPAGMLNCIGLQNVGIDVLIDKKLPELINHISNKKVRIIVNIAGESVEEYGELAERLTGCDGVAAVELNVSCPNLREDGRAFGHDISALKKVTELARHHLRIPVIVKLTPNVSDITEYARAAEDAGADALTVSNTYIGMAIDTAAAKPVLSNITGGLSGPAIQPMALAAVWQVCGAVTIPVIACGGIASADDALQFLMAGARAVQIGTAGFVNPDAAIEIPKNINLFLDERGYDSIHSVISLARQ